MVKVEFAPLRMAIQANARSGRPFMIQALSMIASKNSDAVTEAESEDYVTFVVEGQMFGIPVVSVQDILIPERIAPISLAPPEVKGAINLRMRLGLPKHGSDECMGVTVEHRNEPYTLQVDEIGDVISLSRDLYEEVPGTLDPVWRKFALGVFRLDSRLMVVLDVTQLLNLGKD